MVSRWWLVLGVGCAGTTPLTDGGDDSTTTTTDTFVTDSGEATDPEPEFGVLMVNVDGRDYELELLAPVSLADTGRISMEWRAEHAGRIARLTAFLLDEQVIEEGTYEVGQWGGNFEQFGITLRLTNAGVTTVYQTPNATTTKGQLSIDALDREGGTVSSTWTADLEQTDLVGKVLGTTRVTSTMVGAPMRLY